MQPESERQGNMDPEAGQPGMPSAGPEPGQPESTLNAPEIAHPGPKIWGPWPTIGLGAAVFAINSAAQVIVALIFAVILLIGEYSVDPNFDPFQFATDLTSNGLMLALAIIVSAIAGVGFIILFIKVRKGASVSEYLGLQKISIKLVLSMLGLVLVLLGISFGIENIITPPQSPDIISEAYKNTRWPVLFWMAIVIFAPIYEEWLFRGFLFVGLKRSAIGPVGTIILTALAFASLHALQYEISGVAVVFMLGIVFGVVRLVTGSLWSSIILHSAWNLSQMVIMTLMINGVI